MTDHVDFISLDSFMAFADHVYYHLRISGLEVPDETRVLSLEAQEQAMADIKPAGKNSKGTRKCKNWIKVVGWKNLATRRRKANADELERKM